MAAMPDTSGSKVARALADATMPRRARKVLQNLLDESNADLTRQLQSVLNETEVVLSRPASPVHDPKIEAMQFSALQSVRQNGQGFIKLFLSEVEAALAAMHAPRRSMRLTELHAPVQGLSLVDDDAMTDQAMLNNIASRLESRNSLALQLMGQRLGVLAGAPAFDAEHMPLGPYALCHALHQASEIFDMPLALRMKLYREYERAQSALYSILLDTLNERLAKDGILPHLSYVPVRARPATPGAEPSPRTTATQPAVGAAARLDTPPLATAGLVAGAGTMGRANFGQNAPDGMLPARTGPLTPSAQVGQAGPSGSGSPRAAGGGIVSSGFAKLQNLLKRRRVLLAKLRPGGQDERVREPLKRDEVLASLQRMRSASTKSDGIADFRQALLAQARQMHGHGVALSDPDGDTFELLSLFYAQMQRELRKGSPGEVLVERLRLPLLQLALRDHRFFVDANHPGRLLLDAVSLSGARWLAEDDMDPQWLGLLQRAVATVQEDSDGAFDSFSEANQTLQSGLQALGRKTEMAERRQVEAARGREKLEVARQRAGDEVARLLHGRTLPRFHAILLDQAWVDVLSLAHLRHGEQSEAWRELVDMTAAIIDASTGITIGPGDAAFAARVRGALEQVGYHEEDAGAIARQLVNGRAEDVDLASRTELLVQLRARARLGEGAVLAPESNMGVRTPAEQAALEQLRKLPEPVWVEFDEPDAALVRRRLAWVSQRTGQTLIVNRRGLRSVSEDLDLLARKLAAGSMRLLDKDAAPAEAAWEATMASLQRIAAETPDPQGPEG